MIKAEVERVGNGTQIQFSMNGYDGDLGIETLGLISTLMHELKAASETTYIAVIATLSEVPDILAGEVSGKYMDIKGGAN